MKEISKETQEKVSAALREATEPVIPGIDIEPIKNLLSYYDSAEELSQHVLTIYFELVNYIINDSEYIGNTHVGGNLFALQQIYEAFRDMDRTQEE